ncbi:hypothetical protein SNEBB_005289, partial [Seison nebaliae]
MWRKTEISFIKIALNIILQCQLEHVSTRKVFHRMNGVIPCAQANLMAKKCEKTRG